MKREVLDDISINEMKGEKLNDLRVDYYHYILGDKNGSLIGKIDPYPSIENYEETLAKPASDLASKYDFHHRIFVSPHARTLITAGHIAKGIYEKTKKVSTIAPVPQAKENY